MTPSTEISRKILLIISKAPGDTRKQKANQMESNVLVAIFNLAEKTNSLTWQQFYKVECLSVYNVDGSMRKTQKSKLLEDFMAMGRKL